MCDSFIILNRKVTQWEWYHDHKMYKLFIHCLLKANWKDKKWMGITIKRSSFITSLQKLSEETGLTVKEVRGALSRLEVTGEIILNKPESEKKGKPYTLVTVCKYDIYQSSSSNKGTGRAQEGQAEGTGRATTKEDNNINNDNNNIINRAIEENFELVFQDEKYLKAITENLKLNIEELRRYYLEFNQHLNMKSDTVKTKPDYVSHFRSWYLKRYNINPNTGKPKPLYKNTL